jgi:hypothetical protein
MAMLSIASPFLFETGKLDTAVVPMMLIFKMSRALLLQATIGDALFDPT